MTVELDPGLLATIGPVVDQAKTFQVGSAGNPYDVDQLVNIVVAIRNNMNTVHALYQDMLKAKLTQDLKLEVAERNYEKALSIPLGAVDHKVYRSEGERRAWAEGQISGNPALSEYFERKHRCKAIDMLITSLQLAYNNLDKSRGDVQTILALLNIKASKRT